VSKKEQADDKAERFFYYYCCEGKYEDDESGGIRCICSGHIFTPETRMARCPVCGNLLAAFKTKKERPEAITCALGKCISCENREQSNAVNVEYCLGGESYKYGGMKKVIGTELCNGCQCADCCKEISDDAYAMKKHGLNAVVEAQARLRKAARHILQTGNLDAEGKKLFVEIRTQNAVLHDIRYEIYERWAMDAYHAVEKQMTDKAKAQRIQNAQNKKQEHREGSE
jgi:hypothetical protein